MISALRPYYRQSTSVSSSINSAFTISILRLTNCLAQVFRRRLKIELVLRGSVTFDYLSLRLISPDQWQYIKKIDDNALELVGIEIITRVWIPLNNPNNHLTVEFAFSPSDFYPSVVIILLTK